MNNVKYHQTRKRSIINLASSKARSTITRNPVLLQTACHAGQGLPSSTAGLLLNNNNNNNNINNNNINNHHHQLQLDDTGLLFDLANETKPLLTPSSAEPHFDDSALDSPPTMIKNEAPESPFLPVLSTNQLTYPRRSSLLYQQQQQCQVKTEPSIFPLESGGAEAAQLDMYREFIIRHLMQDITATCNKLAIPTDPCQWSADQSGRWVEEMTHQLHISSGAPPGKSTVGSPQLRQFCLPGRVLCAMTPDEFICRLPDGGETLHAQLQLWKTAAENCQTTSSSMTTNYNFSPDSTTNQYNCPASPAPATGHHPYQHEALMPQLSLTDFLNTFTPNNDVINNNNNNPMCSQQQQTSAAADHHQHEPNATSTTAVGGQQQQHYRHASFYQSQCHGGATTHQHQQSSYYGRQASGQFAPNNGGNTMVSHNLMPSPTQSDPSDSGISADSYQETSSPDVAGYPTHLRNHYYASGLSGHPTHQQQQMPQLHPHQLQQQHMQLKHLVPRRLIGTGGPTGNIHLWQFIRELLDNPAQHSSCVRWLDRKEGIFKIENSHHLARLWGQRKNRSKMNYDKLSRSLRQYYKKNIIKKTGQKQRLIYQFIPPYHFA